MLADLEQTFTAPSSSQEENDLLQDVEQLKSRICSSLDCPKLVSENQAFRGRPPGGFLSELDACHSV